MEKARPDCVSDHTLDARFGCDESPQVCRSSDVPRSFGPNSGLAGAECRLRHPVLRDTWEEPFERPLPNLVVDFCQPAVPEGLCGRELTPKLSLGGQIPSAGPGRAGRVRAVLE